MAKSFRRMPRIRQIPFLGSIFTSGSSDRAHIVKRQNYERLGPIYRQSVAPGVHLVQLFDPVDMETVFRHDGVIPRRPPLPLLKVAHDRDGLALGLGSLNGEEWQRVRSSVQHIMLRPSSSASYIPAHDQIGDDLVRFIQHNRQPASGEVDNLYTLFLRYALEAIGVVCFNHRLGCLGDHPDSGDTSSKSLFPAATTMFECVAKTMVAFPWYAFFRTKDYRKFVEAKSLCNRVAGTYISEAMRENEQNPSVSAEERSNPNFLRAMVAKERLSVDDVVAITTDFFVAGIDSAANALSFLLYSLSQNPDVQEKLVKRVDSVMGDAQVVTSQHLNDLRYLKACLKESFRMNFPVSGGPARMLQSDLVLSGYLVPKGTMIQMNNQTLCLHANHFSDPDRFLPERWLKNSDACTRARAHPFVMLPFGHGPRMCVGKRFAEQEVYIATIKILRQFRLEYHHEPIGLLNRVFNMPDGPLRFKFVPRSPDA